MALSFFAYLGTDVGRDLLIAFLATLLPSPTDPIYWALQTYLYNHKKTKGIYVLINAFLYYANDSLWFLALLFVAWILNINNVSTTNTITTIFIIAGIGAVIGIIGTFLVHKRNRKKI